MRRWLAGQVPFRRGRVAADIGVILLIGSITWLLAVQDWLAIGLLVPISCGLALLGANTYRR